MTTGVGPAEPGLSSPAADVEDRGRPSAGRRVWSAVGFKNIGAIWVWVAIIVLFSILAPDTFPTLATVKSTINQNALSGMVALAVVIPLAAGVFDLSFGGGIALTNCLAAWLIVHQGVPVGLAILLTVLSGVAIGLVNAFVVVVLRVESFIATLATGSLLSATVIMVSNSQAIVGNELTHGFFSDLSVENVGGITVPAIAMFAVAIVVWIFLEHTVTGRRCFATGFNMDAARLVGLKTRRLQAMGLIVSGTVVGVIGVLLCSSLQSGSPDAGPSYLLSALTATFLGSTQFKGGRFNAWGTLVAVLVLGTGSTGLLLIGAPAWASQMFTGTVLIFALALAAFERGSSGRWGRRRQRRRTAEHAVEQASPT
jgi:ribose transport system permease protein